MAKAAKKPLAKCKAPSRWAVVYCGYQSNAAPAKRGWYVCLKCKAPFALEWPDAYAKAGPFATQRDAKQHAAKLDKRDGK